MKIQAILLLVTFLTLNTIFAVSQETSRKALIVIDIQKNLVNPESRIHIDTANLQLFFNNLNQSISLFNSNNMDVIYIVNEWTNPFMNWFTGNVCKKGTEGAGLDSRLHMVNNKIYSKSKSNALTNLELLSYLKSKSITELYIVGLLAEGCVKYTVKGAIDNNFKVVVLEDAIAAKKPVNKEKSIAYYKSIGAKVLNLNEILYKL